MTLRDRVVEAALELTRVLDERQELRRYEECEVGGSGRPCFNPRVDFLPLRNACCAACHRNADKLRKMSDNISRRKVAAARLYRLCRRLAREEGRA